MIREYLTALPLFSRNARLFLVAAGLSGFSYSGVYFLLANLYVARLGFDAEFIGLFMATGALSFSMCSVPAGLAGRRWGCRSALTAGYLVLAVGMVLLSLAPLIEPSVRARWLLGSCVVRELGNSFFVVNANPFLMEATTPVERGHVFSARGAVVPLAGFVGNLLGGALPAWFGAWSGRESEDPILYLVPLLVSGVVLLPGWAALLLSRDAPAPVGADPAAVVSRPAMGPAVPAGLPPPPLAAPSESPAVTIAVMCCVGFLYIGAMAATMGYFNLYMDGELGVPTARIGAIMATGQLLAVPVALTMAALVQRLGYGNTFLLSAAAVVLCALPLILSDSWWLAGAGAVGMTVVAAVAFPAITVYQQELVEPDWRPLMSGAYMMATALGWSAVAGGGGYVIEAHGYRALFLIGALLTTAGTALFGIYSLRRARRLA